MIILLLGLLSVSAIYAVRLLFNKKMRVASLAIVTLYATIVAWIYSLFVFDAASLGFNGSETWRSILVGSDIYRSFIDLTDTMSTLPDTVLQAITYVSIIILLSAILVVVHGTYSVAQAMIKCSNDGYNPNKHDPCVRVALPGIISNNKQIILLNCRMNC